MGSTFVCTVNEANFWGQLVLQVLLYNENQHVYGLILICYDFRYTRNSGIWYFPRIVQIFTCGTVLNIVTGGLYVTTATSKEHYTLKQRNNNYYYFWARHCVFQWDLVLFRSCRAVKGRLWKIFAPIRLKAPHVHEIAYFSAVELSKQTLQANLAARTESSTKIKALHDSHY